VLPLILWTCLWLNLNSGPWDFQLPQTADDWQLLIRANLPFAVLPFAALLLLSHRQIRLPWSSPLHLLLVYGALVAFAALFSPMPAWSAYWSVAFLATILVAASFPARKDPIGSTRFFLQITWLATFLVAAIIAYQGRGLIFGNAPSAYGIDTELGGLSRSSGVARWAAVPGLVCIIRAFYSRRIAPIAFYLGGAAAAFFIVYRMQSRGAVFGAAAALLFILLISSRMRRYALPFAVVAVVGLVIIETPQVASNRVSVYIMRGQSPEEFRSMTGRTEVYKQGLEAFTDAPFFGRGQWADRMILGTHSHNSFLQAMLNGGAIGAVPYVGSWIMGWLLFFKLQKRRARLVAQDRLSVLECGTVMMFFTVRAIPETTTASFAVDLLVMVAVYVYLETLWNRVNASRRWLLVQLPQRLFLHPATALAVSSKEESL
jgi:O-antigen ligase